MKKNIIIQLFHPKHGWANKSAGNKIDRISMIWDIMDFIKLQRKIVDTSKETNKKINSPGSQDNGGRNFEGRGRGHQRHRLNYHNQSYHN